MQYYLMIGLGAIGLPVANRLAEQGFSVVGVSRHAKPALSDNILHIVKNAQSLLIDDLDNIGNQISHVCITVTPSEYSEQGYYDSYLMIAQKVVDLAQQLPNLQRVVFISSTGVYGQNSAEIIDVTTPIIAVKQGGSKYIWQAEQLLQQHFLDKCTIIRPSGIYGKTRLRLVQMAKQLANGAMTIPENSWTNRIFDTDLVNVMVNVLMEKQPLPMYLATDFQVATLHEVLQGLADDLQLSLTLPNELPKKGKRLISNLPKDWLQYPNWQTGYQAILAAFT